MKYERKLTFDFLSGLWKTNRKDPESGIRLVIHYKRLNPENISDYNCKVNIVDNTTENKELIEFTYCPEVCSYIESENILMFNHSDPCYYVKWVDDETIIFGFKDSSNTNKEWFEKFFFEN